VRKGVDSLLGRGKNRPSKAPKWARSGWNNAQKLKKENTKRTEKIMKRTNKTLATAVALAACVGTQLFAQNSKEGDISFSITAQGQKSVSTTTALDVGNWSQGPRYYKTGTAKLTQANLLQAIGYVVHGNASYYSASAKLILSQGELSGFFTVSPDLAPDAAKPKDVSIPGNGTNWVPTVYTSTIIPADSVTFVDLANGRDFGVNPVEATNGLLNTINFWPVGHFQPWGQIFVKDPGHGTVADPLCDNVTFFFNLAVQECYDCFYMNSFISDATFTESSSIVGPPCCSHFTVTGRGVDHYYLTLQFDDTQVNPFLTRDTQSPYYTGFIGVPETFALDGIIPDDLAYEDPIASGIGAPSPFEARFTLNGILTYSWSLTLINKSDVSPDFIGSAAYVFNGYGFIGLICDLLTGTMNISEKSVKAGTCCDEIPWYDSWYGIGYNGVGFFNDGNGDMPFNVPLSLTYHVMPINNVTIDDGDFLGDPDPTDSESSYSGEQPF